MHKIKTYSRNVWHIIKEYYKKLEMANEENVGMIFTRGKD